MLVQAWRVDCHGRTLVVGDCRREGILRPTLWKGDLPPLRVERLDPVAQSLNDFLSGDHRLLQIETKAALDAL